MSRQLKTYTEVPAPAHHARPRGDEPCRWVTCVNCGWVIGDLRHGPGFMPSYRCVGCDEWPIMFVIAHDGSEQFATNGCSHGQENRVRGNVWVYEQALEALQLARLHD